GWWLDTTNTNLRPTTVESPSENFSDSWMSVGSTESPGLALTPTLVTLQDWATTVDLMRTGKEVVMMQKEMEEWAEEALEVLVEVTPEDQAEVVLAAALEDLLEVGLEGLGRALWLIQIWERLGRNGQMW